MILLPQYESLERSPDGLTLQFVLPPTLDYFEGHFPAVPLLPGVVQIGWAIEIARAEIPLTNRFRGLAGVKFMRVMQPGATVNLLLSCTADRRELTFEYRSAGHACSGGRVLFH